jgi:mRNA-degrading endonuclease RelE of RelBE toxin-antitoxin system
MKIYQSRIFEQKAKKLSKAQKAQLDEAVKSIVQNTSIGVKKKGDLRDVYVLKFFIAKQKYLLA